MTFIGRWSKKVIYGVSGSFNTSEITFNTIGAFAFNPSLCPGIYTFQVSLEVTSGYTVEIRLYDISGSTVVTNSTLSSTSLVPEIKESSIELTNDGIYEIQLRVTSVGGIGTCKSAGIKID